MLKFEDLTSDQKNAIVGDWQSPSELALVMFAERLNTIGYNITDVNSFHETIKNCGDYRIQQKYSDLFLSMMNEKDEYVRENMESYFKEK